MFTTYFHPRHSRRHSDHSSSESDSASASANSSEEEEDEEEEHSSHGRTSVKRRMGLVLGVVIGGAALGALIYFLVQQNASSLASPATTVASSSPTSITGSETSLAPSVAATSVANTSKSPTKTSQSPTATAANSTVTAAPAAGSGIAASYSLTPAAVASLPFPSSAIEDSGAAQDYISSSWKLASGNSKFASFVADPFDTSSGGFVLQVEYPDGHYAGDGPSGGISGMVLEVFGSQKPERAMVTYEVAFSDGFDFVKGGKLPGLFGGDHENGCAGGSQSDLCFSLRLMWRTSGQGEAYTPKWDAFCDDTVECNDVYGMSVERGSWTFKPGEWTSVSEVAVLNSDPGTPSEANGVLAMYQGEKEVFVKKNMVFRIKPDINLSALFLSTFFGGSKPDFASTGLCYAYFRNFQFWSGEGVSSETGDTVTATIPGGL